MADQEKLNLLYAVFKLVQQKQKLKKSNKAKHEQQLYFGGPTYSEKPYYQIITLAKSLGISEADILASESNFGLMFKKKDFNKIEKWLVNAIDELGYERFVVEKLFSILKGGGKKHLLQAVTQAKKQAIKQYLAILQKCESDQPLIKITFKNYQEASRSCKFLNNARPKALIPKLVEGKLGSWFVSLSFSDINQVRKHFWHIINDYPHLPPSLLSPIAKHANLSTFILSYNKGSFLKKLIKKKKFHLIGSLLSKVKSFFLSIDSPLKYLTYSEVIKLLHHVPKLVNVLRDNVKYVLLEKALSQHLSDSKMNKLIEALGCHRNIPGRDCNNLLYLSIEKGNCKLFELLLNKAPILFTKANKKNKSPLQSIFDRDDAEAFKILLQLKERVGFKMPPMHILYRAIEHNSINIIKYLLATKQVDLQSSDLNPEIPALMSKAISHDNQEILKLLLKEVSSNGLVYRPKIDSREMAMGKETPNSMWLMARGLLREIHDIENEIAHVSDETVEKLVLTAYDFNNTDYIFYLLCRDSKKKFDSNHQRTWYLGNKELKPLKEEFFQHLQRWVDFLKSEKKFYEAEQLLTKALDKETNVGRVFWLQRGMLPPSLRRGTLKKIHDALTELRTNKHTPGNRTEPPEGERGRNCPGGAEPSAPALQQVFSLKRLPEPSAPPLSSLNEAEDSWKRSPLMSHSMFSLTTSQSLSQVTANDQRLPTSYT